MVPKWFLIMPNIVASVPEMFSMIRNHLGLVADDFGKIFPAGFEKSLHGLYMIVPPPSGGAHDRLTATNLERLPISARHLENF